MVFVAMRIPYLGVIIRVFNTLIHESAHASMAMLTSGKILKIELQNDTSGTTLSVAKNKRSQFLVAIVGYPLAAAAGYLLFWAIAHAYNVYALYVFDFVCSSFLCPQFLRHPLVVDFYFNPRFHPVVEPIQSD
jgi:hypothetical protein